GHPPALAQVTGVFSGLRETLSIDAIMHEVCEGIRAALGFHNVSVELIDDAGERAVPTAVVGWTPEEVAASQSGDVRVLRRLLDPQFEVGGCSLPPSREACA